MVWQRKLTPPPTVDINIYTMTAEEKKAWGIKQLPYNLYNAVMELDNNPVIQEALGVHIYDRFREARLKEWEEYKLQVHDWEVKQYLARF
jgi:glutamine synthetase